MFTFTCDSCSTRVEMQGFDTVSEYINQKYFYGAGLPKKYKELIDNLCGKCIKALVDDYQSKLKKHEEKQQELHKDLFGKYGRRF